MLTTPRMTTVTKIVLRVLMDTKEPAYGARLAEQTQLASGTLYPVLRRLEGAGWLSSKWVYPYPGAKPWREYAFTEEGRQSAIQVLRKDGPA